MNVVDYHGQKPTPKMIEARLSNTIGNFDNSGDLAQQIISEVETSPTMGGMLFSRLLGSVEGIEFRVRLFQRIIAEMSNRHLTDLLMTPEGADVLKQVGPLQTLAVHSDLSVEFDRIDTAFVACGRAGLFENDSEMVANSLAHVMIWDLDRLGLSSDELVEVLSERLLSGADEEASVGGAAMLAVLAGIRLDLISNGARMKIAHQILSNLNPISRNRLQMNQFGRTALALAADLVGPQQGSQQKKAA